MPVRSFSQLAVVFVALFTLLVLGSLFPFQPLDAAWQIRLGAVLVNAATLPLLALALLQLARQLSPRDPRIQRRQQRFAQLAIAASLGGLSGSWPAFARPWPRRPATPSSRAASRP